LTEGMNKDFRKGAPVAGEASAGRFELLYRVSDAMTSTLEPRAVLHLILQKAVEALGATSGSLILMDRQDPEVLVIEVAYNLDAGVVERTRLRQGEGVTGYVAQSGEPLVVPDVSGDDRYIQIDESIHSEIAAPLKLADQVIGVINLDSTRPDAFSQADLEILVPLANHAAKVIQNAQLFDSVRQKAEALRLLQSISQSITASLDCEVVFQRIVRGAVLLLEAKLGSLFLLEENGEELRLITSHGQDKRYPHRPVLPVKRSRLGDVIASGKPVVVANVQEDERFLDKEYALGEELQTLVAVPLILERRAIGVLAVYFDFSQKMAESQIDLLSTLADQSAIAIQNARLHERIVRVEEQVHHYDKVAAVGETASGLAHEIRNPLAVINMLVSSLEGDFPQDDARRQDVRVIRENIEHIHGLVEQLLDAARYRPPVPKPTDLPTLIENTVSLVGPKLSRAQIRLRRQFAPALPPALVDESRMQQVLLNLLQNAIDAIGSRGEITLGLDKAGEEDRLSFSIHDSGPGIPAEAYQYLFEPFHTTKERGVGLGLSIVKRIVEQHGGAISVRSTAGEGTRFTILLPIASPLAEEEHPSRGK